MIPIYEQGRGKGIGLSLSDFRRRFVSICKEHTQEGRAKAFAFIFYDFEDQQLRRILKNGGAFTELDRLSGKNLSIFYLHTAGKNTVKEFNSNFLTLLGVHEKVDLPCIVFFKLTSNTITEIRVVPLERANLIQGFHELYESIQQYIDGHVIKSRHLRWIKGVMTLIGTEALETILEKLLQAIPLS